MRPFAWEGKKSLISAPRGVSNAPERVSKIRGAGRFCRAPAHIHLAAAPFLPVQAHCEPGSPDCETLPQAACRAWRDSAWTFVTIFQEDAR